MSKWAGGIIRKTRVTPGGSDEAAAASGVWRVSDAAYWKAQGLWPTLLPPDTYFNQTTLLLQGDGTNNAQNNTIVDQSGTVTSFTRNGSPSLGSYSPYGTRWSNYFDADGDYLSINAAAALSFGQGDFTIEAWVFPTAVQNSTYSAILEARSGAYAQTYAFGLRVSGGVYKLEFYTGTQYTGTTTININTWTHVAVTRSGGTLRLFVNGVLDSSWTVTGLYVDANGTSQLIGRLFDSSVYPLQGYISNLRVVKETALYTSTFTPPTSALTAISGTSLLTCQSNRLVDNSTNNITITRYGDVKTTNFSPFPRASVYNSSIDGGSVVCPDGGYYTSAFNGTLPGDFTIEGWFYPTIATGVFGIFTTGNESGGRIGWFSENLTIGHNIYGNSSVYYGGATIRAGQWNHIAIVRSGSTTTAYVNGTSVGSQTLSGTLGNANQIGMWGGPSGGLCYVSGYRIVRGTAVYTSNFTPPTTPPTAITNTMLLINGTSGGIIDSTSINNLTTVADAKVSTSIKKYGTGSIYVDGTGDWLTIPGSDAFHYASSNFTMEGWFYFTNSTVNALQTIFSNYTTWGAAHGTIFWGKHTSNSGYMTVWISNYSTSSPLLAESSYPPNNEWVHYALVRNGNTFTLYRNGTSTASASWSGAATSSPGPTIFIGTAGDATQYTFPGYIDDFRITKGIARYTANFTPPTSQFTAK